MTDAINPGLYKHFRNGNLYQVLYLARHSETLAPLVVYQALYGSYGMWVRPAEMFLEKVTDAEGNEVTRFQYVGAGAAELPKLR